MSAVIGGLIGKAKGEGSAGAGLGFLLGPIGWLIVFNMRDQRVQCPDCLAHLPHAEAKRCRYCGTNLEAAFAKKKENEALSRAVRERDAHRDSEVSALRREHAEKLRSEGKVDIDKPWSWGDAERLLGLILLLLLLGLGAWWICR